MNVTDSNKKNWFTVHKISFTFVSIHLQIEENLVSSNKVFAEMK